MERLTEDTIIAVRQAPHWIGVMSSYVALKKRGRNWIGLCPFHSEKSPSFTVSEEKRLWHCFGCQQSGDLIAFIQKIEAIGFSDAVQLIANRLGITVAFDAVPAHQSAHDADMNTLREMLGMAKAFYRQAFESSAEAQAYLAERGVTPEMARQFGIGYSSRTHGVMAYLKQKGMPDDMVQRAGLGTPPYDRLAHRVVFPIADEKGRTIAFGGRALTPAQQPKYLNSDETPLFAKRRTLFGLDHAKGAIKKTGTVILVEGYLDVIHLHQAGKANTVAALGTAFTTDHARIIQRMANRLVLALDTDDAGMAAMMRAYELAIKEGLTVRMAVYEGKDPADALQANPTAFLSALDDPLSMLAYQYKRVCQHPPQHLDDAVAVVNQFVPFLKQEQDPVVQRHFIRQLATTIRVDPDAILAKLTDTMPVVRRAMPSVKPTQSPVQQAEEQVLVAMASQLNERITMMSQGVDGWLITPSYRELAVLMLDYPLVDGALLEAIPHEGLRSVLAGLLVNAPKTHHTKEAVAFLKRHADEQTLKGYQEELSRLESETPQQEEAIQAVLAKMMDLSQRIRETE
ncbi:DNA primase [bacterium]|nr:DNA primase [bacterium]